MGTAVLQDRGLSWPWSHKTGSLHSSVQGGYSRAVDFIKIYNRPARGPGASALDLLGHLLDKRIPIRYKLSGVISL